MPLDRVIQVTPPSVLVMISPLLPTATHNDVLGHATAQRSVGLPMVWGFQLWPPSLVLMTVPDRPTTTHWVGLAQATSLSRSVVPVPIAVHELCAAVALGAWGSDALPVKAARGPSEHSTSTRVRRVGKERTAIRTPIWGYSRPLGTGNEVCGPS